MSKPIARVRCLGPSKKEHTFIPSLMHPRICRECRARINRIAPAAAMLDPVVIATTRDTQ